MSIKMGMVPNLGGEEVPLFLRNLGLSLTASVI